MTEYLEQSLRRVVSSLATSETPLPDDMELEFEQPNNPDHGDLSTNVAMKLARVLRRAPRAIAQDIVDGLEALPVDSSRIASIEIAGAGFINFRFATGFLHTGLAGILSAGPTFGQTESGKGKRVLVEYVSANPTGPLTVGHGRNAVLGDTIANLFAACGYDVTREYYFNDAGRQMRVLGESVRARYLSLVNPDGETRLISSGETELEVPASFPEDGYLGGYIVDIARALYEEHGDSLVAEERVDPFQQAA